MSAGLQSSAPSVEVLWVYFTVQQGPNETPGEGEVWGAGGGGDADCGENENRISNHLT